MSSVDTELLEAFRLDGEEALETLEALAVDWVGHDGQWDELLRILHTFKATSHYVDLPDLGDAFHKAEDIGQSLRGAGSSPGIGDWLLELVDGLRAVVRNPTPEQSQGLSASLLQARERIASATGGLADDGVGTRVGPGLPDTASAIRSAPVDHDSKIDSAAEIRLRVDPYVVEALFEQSEALRVELQSKGLPGPSGRAGRLGRSLLELRNVRFDRIVPRLKRCVRDACRATGKTVAFEVEGVRTTIDGSALDILLVVLPQLLRNSVDHGMESDAARREAGKSAPGRIKLKVHRRAGHLLVEVEDDGVGLDDDRLLARALDRGLIAPSEAPTLTRYERLRLIFAPGFTTRRTATSMSGRGVGLDIADARVQALGGAIEVESERGRGTRFEIRIPESFRVDDMLIVRVGEHRLGIPVSSVVSLVDFDRAVTPTDGAIEWRNETDNVAPDEVFPLIGLADYDPRFGHAITRPFVVLDLGGFHGAMAVDAFDELTTALVMGLPAETRTPLLSGLGRDSRGEVFQALELDEIARDVNAFMVPLEPTGLDDGPNPNPREDTDMTDMPERAELDALRANSRKLKEALGVDDADAIIAMIRSLDEQLRDLYVALDDDVTGQGGSL